MSQGYQMYPPKCYKTPEHLFRLSPRQTLFRSCRGLFRGTFCNFVARNDKKHCKMKHQKHYRRFLFLLAMLSATTFANY